jgi:hypothetical protein
MPLLLHRYLLLRQILTTLCYPDNFLYFKVNFLAPLGGARPSESVRKMLRKLGLSFLSLDCDQEKLEKKIEMYMYLSQICEDKNTTLTKMLGLHFTPKYTLISGSFLWIFRKPDLS